MFRPLKTSDYDKQYIELLKQLSIIDKSIITQKEFSKWISCLSPQHHMIYVLECNSKIIATATLLLEPKLIHNFGLVGHIEDVVVDKQYRSAGYGKKIIDYLTNLARERGCYKVILDCNEKNVNFYTKCDYTKHGVEMAIYME